MMPDYWVILELSGVDHHFRLLMSWSGGYLYGDSWRINSGVASCEQTDDSLVFKGASGSEYTCHKDRYGLSTITEGILRKMQEDLKMPVKVLDGDIDWTKHDWIIS